MQLNKEQMQLMKVLETRLQFALQTIEALNKNIHCNNGQEHPVSVIDKNGSTEFFSSTEFFK